MSDFVMPHSYYEPPCEQCVRCPACRGTGVREVPLDADGNPAIDNGCEWCHEDGEVTVAEARWIEATRDE